jgi:hypothetical protein
MDSNTVMMEVMKKGAKHIARSKKMASHVKMGLNVLHWTKFVMERMTVSTNRMKEKIAFNQKLAKR